jgi:putative two-component system response regulator
VTPRGDRRSAAGGTDDEEVGGSLMDEAVQADAAKPASLILVVDDVEQNRALLGGLVRSLGYRMETAGDGLEALAKLALGIDLVLLDVMMPGLDGYEVARRVRADPRTRDLPIILVTVLDSREDRLKAIQAGASDFIAKPVDRTELMVRISSQLRLKEAQDALKRGRVELEETVTRRTAELRRSCEEAAEARQLTYEAHVDTIRRLVLAAEMKDPDTARHIVRIARYSAVLAKALAMSAAETEVLGHAVTMHDVGKIGIPDAILGKPGALTPAERTVMQRHTLIGSRILADSQSELMRQGQSVALTHHERWNGTGYPNGLAGDDIPLFGRICAVVDVFDAMTSRRPYRPAVTPREAFEAMREGRGKHFDPAILDHFLTRRAEVLAIHDQMRQEASRQAAAWNDAADADTDAADRAEPKPEVRA